MDISIVKGNPKSAVGARLIRMALENMANLLIGTQDEKVIEATLRRLWRQKGNRFSHEHTFEAKKNGETVGIVVCYPVSEMNKLAGPTVKHVFQHRKWDYLKYVFQKPGNFLSLATMREGNDREYHIGILAAMPEHRGCGIGTELMTHVERMAIRQGYQWTSLTVKKENVRARKLYERQGYQIVGAIKKSSYTLFRMVKRLDVIS